MVSSSAGTGATAEDPHLTIVKASGCFTLDKFIAGRTLKEIEKNLGFEEARLAQGGVVVALTQLPGNGQFEVGGYTNVSMHHFKMPDGLDLDVLKRNAIETWEVIGGNRL